jgi:SAM-dependent methyltransferase
MLAARARNAVGADIDGAVIESVSRRYRRVPNVRFVQCDLLDLTFAESFDAVVSYETLEHFVETDVPRLLAVFARALRRPGRLIVSTPYMQEPSLEALEMGFHRAFLIDEAKLGSWLGSAGFRISHFAYQDYRTHVVRTDSLSADFLIAVAQLGP